MFKLLSVFILASISTLIIANPGTGGGGGNGGPGSKPGQVMLLKSVGGSVGGGPGIVLGEDVVDVRLENGDVYDVDYLKDKFGDWVKKEGTLLKLDTRIKIRDVQTAAGEIIAVQ